MEATAVEFGLLVQRFITSRWKTPLGREMRDQLLLALLANEDIKPLLAPHVLKHPNNVEPYDYPYYPLDAIESHEFWVLTDEDLRGIHFYEEDFSGTGSFARTHMSFAHFVDCKLNRTSFEMSEISYTHFENCELQEANFAYAHGCDIQLSGADMRGAYFLNSKFLSVDFSGSDLRGAYFEGVVLERMDVNYLTRFDRSLRIRSGERSIAPNQLPDIYREIRTAYHVAGLFAHADHYYVLEKKANRKYVLWSHMTKRKSLRDGVEWARDWVWAMLAGYGTKPFRTVIVGLVISVAYALIYYLLGTPPEQSGERFSFLTALYFSFTTFATLGYGDLSYGEGRHLMRMLSTSEAWMGAVIISIFVVVVARKFLR